MNGKTAKLMRKYHAPMQKADEKFVSKRMKRKYLTLNVVEKTLLKDIFKDSIRRR